MANERTLEPVTKPPLRWKCRPVNTGASMGSNPLAPLTEVLRAYNESDLLLLPDFGPSAQCANDSCGKILTVIEPPSRQIQSVAGNWNLLNSERGGL